MDRKPIRIKFAASQTFWLISWVTDEEYKSIFQSGMLGLFPVAYVWPENSRIVYDCEARQWVTAETLHPLNSRFVSAAKKMTQQDRARVNSLVRKCLATELDLGENE